MGDMGDIFRDWEELKRDKRRTNLQNAVECRTRDWTIHTEYHWSIIVNGEKLEYWPSRNKFRWRNKNHTANGVTAVEMFIRKQEGNE